MNLLLHATTASQLDLLVKTPSHAILLVGPDGIGKSALAEELAARLLQLDVERLQRHPYYSRILPVDNGTLSIETVRSIQKLLQLKTTGTKSIRRVVCLEHADGLTQEAQNALLKVLEEPPADTVVILTAQSKRMLLPTILSRVQILRVHSPSQTDVETYFADRTSPADVRKAYFLSGGLPGLMHSLLNEDDEHPLVAQVTVAKEVLQKPLFERLSMIDALSKQKDILDPLLSALSRIAQSGLRQAQDAKTMRRWHNIQKEVSLAQDALARSVNSKLVLTNMFLHM